MSPSAVRRLALTVLAAALTLVGGGVARCSETDVPPPAVAEVTEAVLTRHVDGDTAWFRLESGTEEKVRFIGIDTPEVGEHAEPYGAEAAAYTARVVPVGTTVWLETDAELRDKYGRLLAYVWLERPMRGDEAEVREKMLNARIVLGGYASTFTYPPNVKYTDVLKDLQAEARNARRGSWAQ